MDVFVSHYDSKYPSLPKSQELFIASNINEMGNVKRIVDKPLCLAGLSYGFESRRRAGERLVTGQWNEKVRFQGRLSQHS